MKTSKSNTAKASILAASVLLGITGTHNELVSQESKSIGIKQSTTATKVIYKYSEKFMKFKGEFSIAGMDKGSPLYKNSRGEYFTIDPSTGDMKMISSDIFMKFQYIKGNSSRSSSKLANIKFVEEKMSGKVTLVGEDDKGNIIQANSRGEKFYLDPFTGDMVFVK